MSLIRSKFKHLLSVLACAALFGAVAPVLAQAHSPKLAADLARAIGSNSAKGLPWAKSQNHQLYVKVLIVASGTDPKLASLTQAVLAQGGSVHYVYLSVRAMAAMLPVASLDTLAARSDVLAIAPNRSASRSASLVQDITGSASLPRAGGGAALNGAGVGLAVLDSGIDWNHRSLVGVAGRSRVAAVVDYVSNSQSFPSGGWGIGVDLSSSGSQLTEAKQKGDKQGDFGNGLALLTGLPSSRLPDPYGHGTHVASIAAGAGGYQVPDTSGMAPGVTLYDVRVLNDKGVGNTADVLAGIDWVIQRNRLLNIRVMNLSLAADSSDSFLVDPLARAARSAVAAGVVVVVAAGNAGKNAAGEEVYGAIGSPGHEPAVITVGASNPKGTAVRRDDTLAGFSSRGPTRGSVLLPSGERWTDNLLKPDLVAPGNRLLGAVANQQDKAAPAGNLLAGLYPALMQAAKAAGATQALNQELMQLSGTSVSAPVVAGAVALMLQANPGLTPPLVKAILQYTAQPLAGANLLQQGAGQLNVEGAVRLAQALRNDIGPALAAGKLKAGDNLLAPGKVLPLPSSSFNGETFAWGQVVFAGGSHLVSGAALFNSFQPIYDPGLTWVRQVALRNSVQYELAGNGLVANTVARAVVETNASAQALLTPQVLLLDAVVGANSASQGTGLFTATATVLERASRGGGRTLGSGFLLSGGFILAEGLTLGQQRLVGSGSVLSEGFILAEGFILSEGLSLGSGFILAEGFILSEGFILAEGFILSETLADPLAVTDNSLLGQP